MTGLPIQSDWTDWLCVPRQLPPNTVLIATGDVHVRSDLLRETYRALREDVESAISEGMSVNYLLLGDLVDRGPDSSGVLELASQGLDVGGVTQTNLLGNHDDWFLRILRDPIDIHDGEYHTWIDNGGLDTLNSYGVQYAPMGPEDCAALLVGRVPDHHVALLEQLSDHHLVDEYLCVHAGVHPLVPLRDQRQSIFLWIRDGFMEIDYWDHDFTVIHGHTPLETHEIRDHRISIDTGACKTGRLTTVWIEGHHARFLVSHE